MAAQSVSKRVIGGAWTAILGGSGLYTYKYLREFQDRVPCVQDAVMALGSSSIAHKELGHVSTKEMSSPKLDVRWWSCRGHIDLIAGHAHANFTIEGIHGLAIEVFMSAHRKQHNSDFEVAGEDEDDLQVSPWRYYWTRPWELKFLILDRLRWLQGLPARTGSREASHAAVGGADWELDTLFFLPAGPPLGVEPKVLLGDAQRLPAYEVFCARRDTDAKDAAARRRLRTFAAFAAGAAVLAAALRIRKSIRVSRSFGHARGTLLTHPRVIAEIGPGSSVQTSSGTFGARFMNAKLRLVGRDGTAADIAYTATRENESWNVLQASMTTGGRTYDLDRSKL